MFMVGHAGLPGRIDELPVDPLQFPFRPFTLGNLVPQRGIAREQCGRYGCQSTEVVFPQRSR